MPVRAVALLSGGLDSMLAIRILQLQGVQIEALNFRTQFACCRDTAARAARLLDVPLTVLAEQDDYLDVVRRPKFGYGRGANPCVDCRIYMFARAKAHLEAVGADLVVSGEVLGQRPMSQKRRDLLIIERHSGLEGRLLRPLSAQHLPPTWAEKSGAIDRARLYDFSGRSRKGLIALARQFGFPEQEIPGPSTGCMLTQESFAPRVYDLLHHTPLNAPWDFELLKIGRHLRYDGQTKVVVGRRESENLQLQRMAEAPEARGAPCLVPHNFSGPTALVVGPAPPEAIDFAGGLILRFCRHDGGQPPRVRLAGGVREIHRDPQAQAASLL